MKITGEGIGTSIITVSSKENSDIKATCVVTVGAAITGIEVSPKELPLIVDEKGELKATITTEDGSKSNKKVIWTSSNANVATVDQDGKVTGKSLGTAKVTARIEGTNFTDFSTVTVSSPTVPVTHVKIIPEEAEMLVTQSLALEAKVFPENATNKAIKKWETSSEEIATVDANGLVRAKALGEATITVTTEDGDKQASCKITVKSLTTPVDPEFSLKGFVGKGFVHPLSRASMKMQMVIDTPLNDASLKMTIPNDKGLLFSKDGAIFKLNDSVVTLPDDAVTNNNTITLPLGNLTGSKELPQTYKIEVFLKMQPEGSLDIVTYNKDVDAGKTLDVNNILACTLEGVPMEIKLDPYRLQLIYIPAIN